MKKVLETLSLLIPFLEAYPLWTKSLVGAWIVFTAVVVTALLFARAPDSKEGRTRSKVTELIARLEAIERHGEAYTGEMNELAGRSEALAFEISQSLAQEIRRLRDSSSYTRPLATAIRGELVKIRDGLDTGGLRERTNNGQKRGSQ